MYAPRIARVVVPGFAHHVTQRGNNRQDAFFTDDDRRFYLRMLGEQARLHGVKVLAYCLMSNHVHLVVVPPDAQSLELAVGRTHWRYSQAINRLHRRSGHLWQGRFFSCPLDEDHALAAVRYVERNPIRAKLVRLSERYPWSSAGVHCAVKAPAGGAGEITVDRSWSRRFPPATWQRMLREPDDEAHDGFVDRIRGATRTGRPAASDSMLSKLETKLGRRLRAMPAGRPRKDAAAARTAKRRPRRSRGAS